MRYSLTVPARINLLGNPSDANEGDFATLSAAIDTYAGAVLEPAGKIILETLTQRPRPGEPLPPIEQNCSYSLNDFPLPYTGEMDFLKGAFNRLHDFSPEFRRKVGQQGVRIATWSEVPRQSGLGGSSLFILLALCGLRAVYQLDLRQHNDYLLAELTQRVEAQEMQITCGFSDRYVPLFGGLAYLDYRAKLHHKAIRQEPFVTYERLDPWIRDLPLVVICTGIQHDSGDVHSRMRPRYLQEHDLWQTQGGPMPPMVRFMSGAWETAWQGKIALLEGDWSTFGALMNRNHQLVDEMMTYCGFTDGAGWANNLLIKTALQNGALGAKLTGAGSGGSVFALVPPGSEAAHMRTWEQCAAQHGLTKAWIYRPHISKGLTLQAHADSST